MESLATFSPDEHFKFLGDVEARLLLLYTGKPRLAKNLLQNVVGRCLPNMIHINSTRAVPRLETGTVVTVSWWKLSKRTTDLLESAGPRSNSSTTAMPDISFHWSPSKVGEADLAGLGSCLGRYLASYVHIFTGQVASYVHIKKSSSTSSLSAARQP